MVRAFSMSIDSKTLELSEHRVPRSYSHRAAPAAGSKERGRCDVQPRFSYHDGMIVGHLVSRVIRIEDENKAELANGDGYRYEVGCGGA